MLRATLLLLVVIAGLVSCQTNFTGVYPSSYCGTATGCSAEFAICHDLGTGLLQGRYSRVGFIFGYVTNDTFTGNWFESGVAGPLIDASQSTFDAYPNNGPLTLTFTVAGSSISFSGTAYYEGGTDVHYTWNVPSSSPSAATPLSCWSAPVSSPAGMTSTLSRL